MKIYDVIVIGAGALGLASTYFLAKRGKSVLCIDRFSPLHPWSSSVGESRLFRQAYFEDARYIPMLKKALMLWKEIERESVSTLLHQNGFLVVSDAHSDRAHRLESNARAHDIALEMLSHRQCRARFAMIDIAPTQHASFEINAGVLRADAALTTFTRLAQHAGAEIIFRERIISFHRETKFVDVIGENARFRAYNIVLAPGSFINDLVKLPLRFTIKRAVQFWFRAHHQLSNDPNPPCFAFDSNDDFIYGFPALSERGVKIASYHPSSTIENPITTPTTFEASECEPILAAIKRHLPGVAPAVHLHKVCFYCLTDDENFLLDYDPDDRRIVYAAGDSGHAFKFAPVIGDIVARLIEKEPTGFDIDFLRFGRGVRH